MNAEQKQRAQSLLNEYRPGDDAPHVYHMAALLQELVDAHEPKPVARVTGYYAGYLSIATVDGRVLPAGTALYAAPPHQSEHHLEMVNTPAPSVPDVANTFKRRAEEIVAMAVNREDYAKINRTVAALVTDIANAAEATTQAEAPADVARDAERYRWLLENARATAEHWGGRWSLVIDSPAPGKDASPEAINAAIDAAIERQGGQS